MTVALVDYGTGNLHSLAAALRAAGATVRVEQDLASAGRASAMVLPGSGGLADVVARLAPEAGELRQAIMAERPCLAIGVGMDLLFETELPGEPTGLGVLPGRVQRLMGRRVPHVGWDDVEPAGSDPVLPGSGLTAWFAHSSFVEPGDPVTVIAWTASEGTPIPAAIRVARVWGLQFHPEKSGRAGAEVIRRFLAMAR